MSENFHSKASSNGSTIQNFKYRAEIDGLRAIAVLAVVFYHAEISFSGGYVGVDVFFVISGYLITSLILNDIERKKFTIFKFWERRIRRIFPALFLVSLVSLIAGWFLLLPDDYANLGKSAFYQSFFAANIYFWLGGNYFTDITSSAPLLHTWSLAVEEQFYFIFPVFLYILSRFKRVFKKNILLLIFILGMTSSLMLSIFALKLHPSATFYLLPFRAWELALGAIIAIMPINWTLKARFFREIVSYLGLAMILFSCFYYTDATPFPGFAAIMPCFGTALIIWSNSIKDGTSRLSFVGWLLSLRPVVFIGLISYSLYLWHWPLFAFASYLNCELTQIPVYYRFVMIFLSIFMAVISWRFVETPFRQKKLCSSRRASFIFAGASILLIFISGKLITLQKGIPERLPSEAIVFVSDIKNMLFRRDVYIEDVISDKVTRLGSLNGNVEVLVWGDSHAMSVMPAFDEFLREKGLSGVGVTHSSTAPIINFYTITKYGLNKESIAFNDAVIEYIRKNKIRNVVLIAFWKCYEEGLDSSGNKVYGDKSIIKTIEKIINVGAVPWIVIDYPRYQINIPKALALTAMLGKEIDSCNFQPISECGLPSKNPEIINHILAAGGKILDSRRHFINAKNDCYIITYNKHSIYSDSQHMSETGAKYIFLPFLREGFLK